MHGVAELTGIAIVAVAAMVCGMVMVRLRQPAMVGYIFAGVLLGPSGLSLVENREMINLLAQLGVIMLLFFIGMELSLRSFKTIWKIALLSTAAQIGLSVGGVYLVGLWLNWPLEYAILFGFCVALSSTAVAVKILEDVGELRTATGRIAVGILIAQDLAVAPMMVIVANLAASDGGGMTHMILEVSLSIGILLAIILFLTRRSKVNLPFHKVVSPSSELKPLAGLAFCFGFATLAGLIGLSPAFGAFLAGLIVGNSAQRQEVHENAGPIQTVLMMVFFLSIGLLIDLPFVIDHIGELLLLLAVVTTFKLVLNVGVLRLQGQTWQTSISVALVIGQMGEFTFVLAAVGLSTSVIGNEIHKTVVALTVMTLILSPIMMDLNRRIQHRAAGHISSLGALFRFAYFREWRVTKRLSRAGFGMAFRMATWATVRLEKIRGAAAKKLEDHSAAKNRLTTRTGATGGSTGDAGADGPPPDDAAMDAAPPKRKVKQAPRKTTPRAAPDPNPAG